MKIAVILLFCLFLVSGRVQVIELKGGLHFGGNCEPPIYAIAYHIER